MKVYLSELFDQCLNSPRYPFIHLGGEKYYEGQVFCPRTLRNNPGVEATARTTLPK